MASEATINLSLAYEDSTGAGDTLALVNFLKTIATKVFTSTKVSVGITEQAINLGGIASIGYIAIINLDDTNFCELRVGTGGTKVVRLDPGGGALFRFGSGITAPFIIADTAPVLVEYLLLSI